MGDIWSRLGIEATDDATAIRRAYARQLKAIDPEADPQAFIALREARDWALASGEVDEWEPPEASILLDGGAMRPGPAWPVSRPASEQQEPPDVAAPADPHGPADPDAALSAEAPLQPEPPAPADRSSAERTALALQSLLYGEEDPDPAEIEALTLDLLADPEFESVDSAAAVENWLAGLAASSVPRSDAMLDPLVRFFRWEERAGTWDLPPSIALLLERWRSLGFYFEIARPGHPDHRAYLDLVSPAESLGWNRWFRARSVRRLLATIRTRYPIVEDWLNPLRVSLWDHYLGASIASMLRKGAVLFWILFMVVRIFASDFLPSTGGGTEAPTLASGTVDEKLDRVLHALFPGHLTLPALETADPRLVASLRERLRQPATSADAQALSNDVIRMLETAYRRNLRSGDRALQSRYWELRLKELRWLQSLGGSACADELAGRLTSPPKAPSSLQEERIALFADALLAPPKAGREVKADDGSYRIPVWLIETSAKRVGMPPERFAAGLGDKPDRADSCAVHIALIDAALTSTDKRAEAFIKDMSGGL